MNEYEPKRTPSENIIAAATNYLREHYDQEISISSVAAAAGVQARTLQTVFHESLNTTPGNWLLKLRLRRARSALLAAENGTTVTSSALGSGLYHLGRFSHRYREEFGELPSETLRMAQKLKDGRNRRGPQATPDTLRRCSSENHRVGAHLQGEKLNATIEASRILTHFDDIFVAWEQLHATLSGSLKYKRGAVILKRSLDGRPLIFSHCRGDMAKDRFKHDMKRVNIVLTSVSSIVHSVLKSGQPRIENELQLCIDYAALDASVRSEICVPLISRGEVLGAINFESESENAFDLHDLALAMSLSAASAEQLRAARSNGNLGLSGAV